MKNPIRRLFPNISGGQRGRRDSLPNQKRTSSTSTITARMSMSSPLCPGVMFDTSEMMMGANTAATNKLRTELDDEAGSGTKSTFSSHQTTREILEATKKERQESIARGLASLQGMEVHAKSSLRKMHSGSEAFSVCLSRAPVGGPDFKKG